MSEYEPYNDDWTDGAQPASSFLESRAPSVRAELRRGRGALSNQSGRYESLVREADADGMERPLKTVVHHETVKTVISRNDSPDLNFDRSINPYRGCEHGCIYCYARPTHAYLGHSPGLDFETQLYAKDQAAAVLERELADRRYEPQPIALGAVTDPYQPIERERRITRSILEVLERSQHPVGIVTKSFLVTRDIDILARMASRGLVKVALSITTLDHRLARQMEPRASTPSRRLAAIRALSEAGIPTQVMMAPVVPALNDSEIEAVLAAARSAGARDAGYVLLRLPLELKTLWQEWLGGTHPDRARRVMKLMREAHGGQAYRSAFGLRQRGSGPYAELIAKRFHLARRRLGLGERRLILRTDLFRRPVLQGGQFELL